MTIEELFSSKSKLVKWCDRLGWLLGSQPVQGPLCNRAGEAHGRGRWGRRRWLSCPCCSVLHWQLLPQRSLATWGPLWFIVCVSWEMRWPKDDPDGPPLSLRPPAQWAKQHGFGKKESLAKMPHRDGNRQRLKRHMPGRSLGRNQHHRTN